jgi:hypothetical protein
MASRRLAMLEKRLEAWQREVGKPGWGDLPLKVIGELQQLIEVEKAIADGRTAHGDPQTHGA